MGLNSYFRRKTISNDFGKQNQSIRDQWIIEKLSEIPSQNKLLDVGAGQQPYKKYCQHLEYVSQDFAAYNPKESPVGLQMKEWEFGDLNIISDIISIPEPDSSFDAILCSEVIEHVPNPVLALKELSRLLKKNGYIILTAPFCSLTHFAPFHYSTGFNRFFYETHLPSFDLQIIEMSPNGDYFEYLAQELYRLDFVAKTYTDDSLKKKEIKALNTLINALEKFSKKKQHSNELLNFGFHILAQKK